MRWWRVKCRCFCVLTNDVKFLKSWGLYTVCTVQNTCAHLHRNDVLILFHSFHSISITIIIIVDRTNSSKSKRSLSLSHLLARNIRYGVATRQNTEYRLADDEKEPKKKCEENICVFKRCHMWGVLNSHTHRERDFRESDRYIFHGSFFLPFSSLVSCRVIEIEKMKMRERRNDTNWRRVGGRFGHNIFFSLFNFVYRLCALISLDKIYSNSFLKEAAETGWFHRIRVHVARCYIV